MRFPKRLVSTAGLLAAAVLVTAGPASADKPKKDLTDAGYTCVRVAVNFIECTKKGSKTYWCDDTGSCQPKPRVKPRDAVKVPEKGVIEVDPGSGGGGKGATGINKAPPKSKNY